MAKQRTATNHVLVVVIWAAVGCTKSKVESMAKREKNFETSAHEFAVSEKWEAAA